MPANEIWGRRPRNCIVMALRGWALRGAAAAAEMATPLRRLTPRLVQLIHRHGDRSPITKLGPSERSLWLAQLPRAEAVRAVQRGTAVVLDRPEYVDQHPGGGDCVFGQLTTRGMQQMQQAGEECRRSLLAAGGAPAIALEQGDVGKIAVTCTEFNRTLRSVQALLQGLVLGHLPQQTTAVTVGTRGTDLLLPDPEPRWPGQADAEAEVWNSEEVLARGPSFCAAADPAR
jgi:hypothetical protein